ncbi:MAG: hypothetical protein IPG49_09695 [Proteobacteria bacterium]|nr:hypothetical protein [Pseudomonadota bacterium]
MSRLTMACGFAALLALMASDLRAAAPTPSAAVPFDLSGVWMNDNTLDERMKREGRTRQTAEELRAGAATPEAPPLTPRYLEIYQRMQAETRRLAEGTATCEWPGMPTIMTYPYPFEILSTPDRITFLFEAESQVRRIFLNRTRHLGADDLDPSYNGDSIGRWEGTTLVIDTIGFNTRRPVRGLPHSEQMRIVERITPIDSNTISNQITITDPEAFTRPMIINVQYSRRPDWRIREYSCAENNRDAPDAEGQRTGGVVAAPATTAP